MIVHKKMWLATHFTNHLPPHPLLPPRGSQSLQNLVAISQRSLLTLKAGCIGNDSKIGYSIQGLVAKVKAAVANG